MNLYGLVSSTNIDNFIKLKEAHIGQEHKSLFAIILGELIIHK